MRLKALGGIVLLAGVLGTVPAALGQGVDANGLWWGRYDPFGRPSGTDAPGLWWDQYLPENPRTWNGPFYTSPHWEPYVSRPIFWSGLEYSVPNAPPESITGPHGWYGPFSPGPRGFAPADEPDPTPPARPLPPARVAKPKHRQYFRPAAPAARVGWQARDSLVPDGEPEPRVVSAPEPPASFKQYYRQSGRGPWVGKQAPPPTGRSDSDSEWEWGREPTVGRPKVLSRK